METWLPARHTRQFTTWLPTPDCPHRAHLRSEAGACERLPISAAKMVLELGGEGAAFNYVVSAHKPTSVQHSAVGHFTAATDLNLIIS